VAIKPLCLLLAGKFVSADVANLLAIIVTVSAILMAALSFGTYKDYLNSSEQSRSSHGAHRVSVYLFNALLLIVLTTCLSIVYTDWTYFLIISVVILAEHLIHDEARILLYRGHKLSWARQNTIKTLILYGAILVSSLGTSIVMLITGLLVLMLLVAGSYYGNGIFSYIRNGRCFESGFFKRYLSGFEYFKSSLVNKFGQQSDRIYFFLISPDSLWVYALLAQSASVMLTYFDVMHLAKFKSKLLSTKAFKFSFLSLRQFIELIGVGCVVISGVIVLEYFNLFPYLTNEYITILGILVCGNFIVVTNTLNSERLFWSLNNPKEFSLIEVKSFLLGLSIVVPILLMPSLVLVRAPFLLGCVFKLYKAKQCLK